MTLEKGLRKTSLKRAERT